MGSGEPAKRAKCRQGLLDEAVGAAPEGEVQGGKARAGGLAPGSLVLVRRLVFYQARQKMTW